MIAAIALARGTSLVTGNRRHCERIESLRIEDWIRRAMRCPRLASHDSAACRNALERLGGG
jgi:hypothetical protein